MKTIIFTFALSMLSCICFIGCKDKDPTKPGYQNKAPKPEYYRIRFNDEFKSYLFCKPSSYWIYKNTKTNELDTQTCTGFKVDSVTKIGDETYSKHITIQYDRMRRNIYSSFNKWTYYEQTNEKTPNADDFKKGGHKLIRQVYGEGLLIPFTYQFIIGTGAHTGSSSTAYIGMDTTLIIQGKTYFNVAKFEIDRDNIWHPTDTPVPIEFRKPNAIYYWAKNVGLVKRENKSENYSWELIEHQIIK